VRVTTWNVAAALLLTPFHRGRLSSLGAAKVSFVNRRTGRRDRICGSVPRRLLWEV